MMEYDEARLAIAEALERSAAAHDRGDFSEIDTIYDEIDGSLPRNLDKRFEKLYTALYFWDSWIDSSNHDWLYHKPLTAEDWSKLARGIASALRTDREISDLQVLQLFTPSLTTEKGIVRLVRRLFKK
jgi:hypothetical protein